jgi:phosphatidylinositol dimannoside acyltransferase
MWLARLVRRKRPPGEGRLIQLVYYGYVVASALLRLLPEKVAYRCAQGIGSLAARRSKKREQVAKNLARITGKPADSAEVQALVVEAYRSYARYWFETFALVREDREFFLDRFRSEDMAKIEAVLDRGKGAIVAVGHLGNWDAAGAWVGAHGHLLVTVAEVLKPKRMYDFFVDHRAALGMKIHPAVKGISSKLIEDLEAGAVVAILADRDLKGTGPEVTFFGEKATFPGGAASIAIETRIPILVAGVFSVTYEDGKRGWTAEICDPIEIPEGAGKEAVGALTQRIADELARCIAEHPEEWHVFQPFWIADRKEAHS